MISIFNSFSIMELFLNLERKCNELTSQTVTLKYLAPHQKKYVTLNEDDDVRIMTHLHASMRLTIINMRAMIKDQMGSHNAERLESEDETLTSNDGHLEFGLSRNSIDVWSSCIHGKGYSKAGAAWVSNVVMERLRGEPSYRPCMMLKDIQREYGVELNYHKVWKGKELAMHDIHGAEDESYDRLRWYCGAIKETNPESIVEYEIDHCSNKYKRLFICFNACATGFIRGCRPLVFLDGTHIKNRYKGSFLVAVTKDSNDDLFTLAYSVVDVENDDNWGWFCFQLKGALLAHHCIRFDEFIFFSDRNIGIIKAVELTFPSSHHAYCLRHLVDNFANKVMRKYPFHNNKTLVIGFQESRICSIKEKKMVERRIFYDTSTKRCTRSSGSTSGTSLP